jgi:hypothetical protein
MQRVFYGIERISLGFGSRTYWGDIMAKTQFDEFVKRQQTSSATTEINWDQQRDEWLAYLDQLYKLIEEFLYDYVDSGQITCFYKEIELIEENIGSYIARQMVLKIGRQEIDFKPVGTLLIGMKGRVDVYGPAGSARLVLVNSRAEGVRSLVRVTVSIVGRPQPPPVQATPPEEITWEWKIVGRPPEMRFLKLTQESLFDTIMEVANG